MAPHVKMAGDRLHGGFSLLWETKLLLGTQDGPVWEEWGCLENYLGHLGIKSTSSTNLTARSDASTKRNSLVKRQTAKYWLTELGPLGKAGATASTKLLWKLIKNG